MQSDVGHHMMDVWSETLMVSRERWEPPEVGSSHPKASAKVGLINSSL